MKLTARAERGTGWWVVEVPEMPGLFTQTRRLDQIPAMVRDAAAALTGDPEENFDVEVLPVIEEEARSKLDQATTLAKEASDAQKKATELNRQVAQNLAHDGYTVRDIGAVLHVSHQYAHQLIHAK